MTRQRPEKPVNDKVSPEKKVSTIIERFLQNGKKGDEGWLMHEIDRVCKAKKRGHLDLVEVRRIVGYVKERTLTAFEASETIVI